MAKPIRSPFVRSLRHSLRHEEAAGGSWSTTSCDEVALGHPVSFHYNICWIPVVAGRGTGPRRTIDIDTGRKTNRWIADR